MADIWKWFTGLSWASRIFIILGFMVAVSSLLAIGDELNKKQELADINSTEQARYEEVIQNQNREWSEVFEQLEMLLQEPEFLDDDWKVRVATQLNIMQLLIDEARQLDSPMKYGGVHDLFMEGIDELDWVANTLPEAINNKDLALLQECLDKSKSGKSYLEKALTLMDEVT